LLNKIFIWDILRLNPTPSTDLEKWEPTVNQLL